jgi:hypothetical protein
MCPASAEIETALTPAQLLPELSRVQASQQHLCEASTLLRLQAELSPPELQLSCRMDKATEGMHTHCTAQCCSGPKLS